MSSPALLKQVKSEDGKTLLAWVRQYNIDGKKFRKYFKQSLSSNYSLFAENLKRDHKSAWSNIILKHPLSDEVMDKIVSSETPVAQRTRSKTNLEGVEEVKEEQEQPAVVTEGSSSESVVSPSYSTPASTSESMNEQTNDNLDTEATAANAMSSVPQEAAEAVVKRLNFEDTNVSVPVDQPAPEEEALPVEDENVIDTSHTIDRENELPSNETAALTYHANFTEMLSASTSQLLHDKERGNVGAGTQASAPIADLWGNLPTQQPEDKVARPEILFDTKADGTVIEGDTNKPEPDVFTSLPFAKIGGQLLWIPRHIQAAKFFFTSADYDELVSHLNDTDPITLINEDMVDPSIMRDSITRIHTALAAFCVLDKPLPMTATSQQVYAEYLELRQMGRALSMYQQNTAGMYENASISIKGGIRAAVGQALQPIYDKLQLAPSTMLKPLSASMSNKKRDTSSVVQNEEYNPQFSYGPMTFKRVKFSIPTL